MNVVIHTLNVAARQKLINSLDKILANVVSIPLYSLAYAHNKTTDQLCAIKHPV